MTTDLKFITAYSEKYLYNCPLYNLIFPCSIIVLGVPKSGKSYFILNLLKEILANFDEVIVYLGSKDSGESFLNLAKKYKKSELKFNVLFKYNEEDLRKYYKKLEDEQQILIKNNKPPKRILIIGDDIFGLPQFMKTNRTNPSIIEEIYANYRHLNLSIIVTSQKYKQIIPSLRSMSKYIFVCSVGSKDIKQISEEHDNIYFDEKDIITTYSNIRKNHENPLGHIFFIDNDESEKNRFKHIFPNNTVEIIQPLN